MGVTGFGSVVKPTQSLSKIMHGVLGVTLVGAHTALRHALGLAHYSSDHGAMLSQAGIGLDVVNYGTQQGEKTRILNGIVEFTNEDIRCRILNLPHRLHKSDILPKVTEKEDEMIMMTCMGIGRKRAV
ncbi:hypothetical protein Tco_1273883 [Tanacetum coccineum]